MSDYYENLKKVAKKAIEKEYNRQNMRSRNAYGLVLYKLLKSYTCPPELSSVFRRLFDRDYLNLRDSIDNAGLILDDMTLAEMLPVEKLDTYAHEICYE